jgi:6-phosphofructokinase 1
VMVAVRGEGMRAVPVGEVAGKLKLVPAEHPWVVSARRVGTSLGD